jgi:hypothetical protein
MKISRYTYNQHTNILTIYGYSNEYLQVRITENSGKIVSRIKINSPAKVPHPGILVGVDIYNYNIEYFLHNHYQNKCAEIENTADYSKGALINRHYKTCSYKLLTVLDNGLKSAVDCERYHWLDFNCQTYINEACQGNRYSESVNDYKEAIGAALGIAAIGIFSGLLIAAVAKS